MPCRPDFELQRPVLQRPVAALPLEWLARSTWDMNIPASSLLHTNWQRMLLLLWCRMVTLFIADMEQKHARNRRLANPSMSWINFVAVYSNMEACDIHFSRLRSAERGAQLDPSFQPPQLPQHSEETARVQRRPSPMLLYRKEFIAQKQASHQQVNPASNVLAGICNTVGTGWTLYGRLPLNKRRI